MSETDGALACIECGEPIPGSATWVCTPRCNAVMALVRYGRTQFAAGSYPVEDRLNRHRREAEVIGRFPTWSVRNETVRRDKGHCQVAGCLEREVDMVDWRDDDPVLTRRVRAGDVRAVCPDHQRSESLRRFIGAQGRSARTAPAIWARIQTTEPLVARDCAALWNDPAYRGLLNNWPLASAETRADLDAWLAAIGRLDGTVNASDAAIDQLEFTQRRRERLDRAIKAWAASVITDDDQVALLRAAASQAAASSESDTQ
jgi:hypothetical protein